MHKQLSCIIYLIDFHGHPSLGDDHSNNQRYSTLIDICASPKIDKTKTIIVSSKIDFREKVVEVKKIAQGRGWDWIEFDGDTIDDFEQTLFDQGYLIRYNTKIIFGGTNTSGCVFKTKGTSLIKFAEFGYKTELHLPLCAEYHTVGINPSEKNARAYSIIYNEIKKNPKLLDNIEISCKTNEISYI